MQPNSNKLGDAGGFKDVDADAVKNQILNHVGYKVSAQVAEKLSLERYSEFNQKRLKEERLRADEEDIALLEELRTKTPPIEIATTRDVT